jgi:hypothetical protein
MFGTFMTVIAIGYFGWYGYNIIHDLYFDQSGEVVATATVEETEVDIKDELCDFTQYDADEDRKIAEQKTKEEQDSNGASSTHQGVSQGISQGTPHDNESEVTMTGGIEADQVPSLISALENKGEGSDFDIVAKAVTRQTT